VENQIRDQAIAHGISPEDVLTDVLLPRSPIKRLLEAEEVAAAALWLCADHSSYINGTSLPLDGGWGAN
jgi:3-hydroxybutyrate dehydrogenase